MYASIKYHEAYFKKLDGLIFIQSQTLIPTSLIHFTTLELQGLLLKRNKNPKLQTVQIKNKTKPDQPIKNNHKTKGIHTGKKKIKKARRYLVSQAEQYL